jgi:hemolysin III
MFSRTCFASGRPAKTTTEGTVIATKHSRKEPRPLIREERLADAWVHALAIAAAVLSVAALLALALPRASRPMLLALLVYGCGLLAMPICSALYNSSTAPERRDWFRRFDHAAIFLMIAGTYTPFLAGRIADAWARWLLVYVWVVAGTGIALKLIWVHHFARLSVLLYLFLGWSVLAAIRPLTQAMSPASIMLLVLGGILYSVGVTFHLWESLPYQQPIWHGFVVAGAACHYAAVLREVPV